MIQEAIRFLIPLAALFINCCFFIVAFRAITRHDLLKSVVSGFVAGVVVLVLVDFLLDAGVWGLLEDLFIYSMLSYGYFHFVNLSESARRIRLLREMEEARLGLTEAQILGRYNAAEILNRRLERLLSTGQIKEQNGRLFIANPVMLISARIVLFLKAFLLGNKS